MQNQRLDSSKETKLPKELQKRYILKRIKLGDIEISERERNEVINYMSRGLMFVQIGEHTIMLNSLSGIEPKYGDNNIPPSPEMGTDNYTLWLETYYPDKAEMRVKLLAEPQDREEVSNNG